MDSLLLGSITSRFSDFFESQRKFWARFPSLQMDVAMMASHGACYTEECPEPSADCPGPNISDDGLCPTDDCSYSQESGC